MRGKWRAAASSCIVAMAALIALVSGSSSGTALATIHVEPPGQIDIELAFDTTGSMGQSIEQAQKDGASILARVSDLFPGTRFAVVSFRDYGNPSGEYDVLRPMTADIGAIQTAFRKLRPASNPSPFNTSAEEYNLLLHKSYTDASIDWRPHARKVVVVVGDAEPHGAGTSGIDGCTDTSNDHHGLNTVDVLAGMRAAERTLVMIRQISEQTSVALKCYESMTERAYSGGAARDGGDDDLAGPIVALIRSAVVPVELRSDVALALPGGVAGYTATVLNPNPFALNLRSLAVALPAGFRRRPGSSIGVMAADAGAPTRLNWQLERVLRPSEKVSVHFRVSAPKRRGRYAARAVAQLELPGGHAVASTSHGSLRVSPRLRSLVVATRAQRPLEQSGTVSLRGAVRIAFRPGARTLSAGKLLASRLLLGLGPGRSVALRVRSYRILSFGSPTVLRLDLTVERVRGIRRCSLGARGSATIVDNQRFTATGLRRDYVAAAFGSNCRVAAGRWLNVGAGVARSAVTVAAR
jgi:hypothetical protein